MKKLIPLVALLLSLLVFNAHADYDPMDDPNSPQYKKAAAAARARALSQKAENDKKMRATIIAQHRKDLGKAAEGKSDSEVEGIVAKRKADEKKKQDEAMAKFQQQKPQLDATYKSFTGKSMSEIEKMSPAERKAFDKDMEAKQKAQMDAIMSNPMIKQMMEQEEAETKPKKAKK